MKLRDFTVITDSELLSLVSNYDTTDKRSNLKGIKAFTSNTKMYPYAEVQFDYIVGETKIRREGKIIGYLMTNEEVVALIIDAKPIKVLNLRRSTTYIMKTLFNLKRVALVQRTIVVDEHGTGKFEHSVNF